MGKVALFIYQPGINQLHLKARGESSSAPMEHLGGGMWVDVAMGQTCLVPLLLCQLFHLPLSHHHLLPCAILMELIPTTGNLPDTLPLLYVSYPMSPTLCTPLYPVLLPPLNPSPQGGRHECTENSITSQTTSSSHPRKRATYCGCPNVGCIIIIATVSIYYLYNSTPPYNSSFLLNHPHP